MSGKVTDTRPADQRLESPPEHTTRSVVPAFQGGCTAVAGTFLVTSSVPVTLISAGVVVAIAAVTAALGRRR